MGGPQQYTLVRIEDVASASASATRQEDEQCRVLSSRGTSWLREPQGSSGCTEHSRTRTKGPSHRCRPRWRQEVDRREEQHGWVHHCSKVAGLEEPRLWAERPRPVVAGARQPSAKVVIGSGDPGTCSLKARDQPHGFKDTTPVSCLRA
ncbi:hypothetical protein CRG98_018399 [Punica granatum]|uniref:Uncharacterized protein n=1 Tax=Punica granatum TaxID=22663 RepID=A0A2I0JXY8_PUNGR|nr:hypothetical protein CRG98_018399 [Punica granatum]